MSWFDIRGKNLMTLIIPSSICILKFPFYIFESENSEELDMQSCIYPSIQINNRVHV